MNRPNFFVILGLIAALFTNLSAVRMAYVDSSKNIYYRAANSTSFTQIKTAKASGIAFWGSYIFILGKDSGRIYYSRDEGKSWIQFQDAANAVRITAGGRVAYVDRNGNAYQLQDNFKWARLSLTNCKDILIDSGGYTTSYVNTANRAFYGSNSIPTPSNITVSRIASNHIDLSFCILANSRALFYCTSRLNTAGSGYWLPIREALDVVVSTNKQVLLIGTDKKVYYCNASNPSNLNKPANFAYIANNAIAIAVQD